MIVKIHGVAVEPHIPKDAKAYLMICLCEIDGEVSQEDVWCTDLDWAYSVVNHCKTSIEPFVFEVDHE